MVWKSRWPVTYRVARTDARLGLPEVKLGLMPGARGTQHLPRLVGVERALEIIALGDPVGASAAKDMGLVDTLTGGDLGEAACTFARSVIGKTPRRTRDQATAKVNPAVYDEFAKRHPLGMSGARLALTATQELIQTGERYAIATMCIGVGQGLAVLLERT